MNNYLSINTLKSVADHLPEKIIASAGVTSVTSALGIQIQLLAILFVVEVLDILSRWWAESYRCFKALYPQTPCDLWRCIRFMRQAHRWRFFRSDVMRSKAISKLFTFGIILLFSSLCDIAMRLAGGSAFAQLLPLCTVILCLSESLSILENLNECDISIAQEIMLIVKKRKDQIK